MLLDNPPLVIEPTYVYANEINQVQHENDPRTPDVSVTWRNTFWSWRRRAWITIWQGHDGKIKWSCSGWGNQMNLLLGTLSASDAWGIEQESNAVHLLGSLLSHRQFKQYMLMGMFGETSTRSGVFYVFRRLRPTVAISLRAKARVLCTLCMHPIGFYEATWSGAMAPTDDVIAHLMLMRGDEHMFWRRAEQHPAWEHASGI